MIPEVVIMMLLMMRGHDDDHPMTDDQDPIQKRKRIIQ